MVRTLDPSENAQRWFFSGADCLYRDHLGRRVLADSEGFGFADLEFNECRLLPIRDEIEGCPFPVRFKQSLTVLAEDDGPASICLTRGRTEAPSGRAVEKSLPFHGSGWVVESSERFKVDGRNEWAPRPSRSLAIPFFRAVEGHGSACVIESDPLQVDLIDSFDVSDLDALKVRRFEVQNASKPSRLTSQFPDGTAHDAMVISHLNAASWSVRLPAPIGGLILRKAYDQFHGRQRARVLIDDRFVGWWYEPDQDRVRRWRQSDFGIDAEFLVGKGEIRITIDPPPGTPLWSVSGVEVYAL